MKSTFSRVSMLAATLAVAGWLIAIPAGAQSGGGSPRAGGGDGGGSRGGAAAGGGGGGAATGGGGSSVGTSSGGGGSTSSGGGSVSSPGNMSGGAHSGGRDFSVSRPGSGHTRGGTSGGGAVGRQPMAGESGTASSGGDSGTSVGRAQPRDAGVRSGGRDTSNDGGGSAPPYSRPRGDKPATGTAVTRTGPPPGTGHGGDYIYGEYPWWAWGYGGLGYWGYYDPWYDPWDYGGGYGGGGYYPTNNSVDEGNVRLKVKPREAEVYVDGYYTGTVDEYDGLFQRLHLPRGPHHLELRAQGYEPLAVDIRVDEHQTLTYKGELKKQP